MAILVQIWQTATARTQLSELWGSGWWCELRIIVTSSVRIHRLSSKIATTLQLSALIVIGELMLVTVICNFANYLQSETTPRRLNTSATSATNKIDCFVIPVQMILLISKSISLTFGWTLRAIKCQCFILFLHTEPIFLTFCNCVDHNTSLHHGLHTPLMLSSIIIFLKTSPNIFNIFWAEFYFRFVCRVLPLPLTLTPISGLSWCQGPRSQWKTKRISLAEESGGRWGVLGKVDIEDNMWVIARGLSSKCTLFAILMIPRSVPLLS